MNNKYIYIGISILILLIPSCKIGKTYKNPELADMPTTFEDSTTQNVDSMQILSDVGISTMYPDTVLQNLIEKALFYNRDLKIAEGQIKEMLETNKISKANLLPDPGLELGFQREIYDYKSNSTKVIGRATVSWEIDIWGNLRWQDQATFASYMQKVEAKKALQLTLIAEVAQTYFELSSLTKELAIVKQTLKARQDGAQFAKLRYEGGLTSEIPYRQALVELSRTETLVPNLEKQVKTTEYALSILIGEYPSASLFHVEDLNSIPSVASLPAGLPSEILKRRPDVIGAEQMLIEANAKVGVALTSIFPKLTLTGKTGFENNEFANLLKNPSSWFFANLTGPLFNYPKNKARYKGAQANYEQKVYNYEKVVMNVFKEVNSAIISFDKAKDVRESQKKLYESALSYYNLARLQYVNGVVSYLDLLDSQRQLFDAEIGLNRAILQEHTSMVILYKALGGGLEDSEG